MDGIRLTGRRQPGQRLSTMTVAGLLRISELSVLELISAGKLPATRHGGRQYVERAAVEDLLRGRRASAAGEGAE